MVRNANICMNDVCKYISKENCCGCGACFNICPHGAIKMQENNEGFLYPEIDNNICKQCGLCIKVCPSINAKTNNTPHPKCYAAMADDKIRMKSSSGGMFTLVANYILDKGGYICGAAFDEDWNVEHIIVDNKKDLEKLRGSKYVQSNTKDCYKKIKTLLEEDKYVLFSGCPCQVAGLYTFLDKDYEKLTTIEILCHGTPSYKVFRKYLEENHNLDNINKISFRDKNVGWRCDTLTIYNKGEEKQNFNIFENYFEKGFHRGLFNRTSCTPCKYARLPRQGDISIADWWGISKFAPDMNDGKGTSLVLINNQKGEHILNEIKNKNFKIKEIPLESAKNSVNVTIYKPLDIHSKRNLFFTNLNKLSVNKNVKMCLENKFDICCVSIFYGSNYGTILVSYAVNKILENLGYSVLMLNQPDFIWGGNHDKVSISRDFAKKYYNISKTYKTLTEMYELNDICNFFITGSDQMFNPRLNLHKISFLEFVKDNKIKIAFGSSFGHDDYYVDENLLTKERYLLKRFDNIFLREKTDNLCKNIFQIKAEEIIDPTLILDICEFELLTYNNDIKTKLPDKFLLTYILDINPEKVNAINYIADKLNLKIINIQNLDYRQRKDFGLEYLKDYTPEEFLYLYKKASFVVTDSYHGTCFAVKFNKQFISFINKGRGEFRYKIFDIIKVSDRILNSPSEIYNNINLFTEFDFAKTNRIIKQRADKAIELLQKALKNRTKPYSDKDFIMDAIHTNICQELESITRKNSYNIFLIMNKKNIYYTYYRYKLLSKILLDKKRKHYEEKAKIWHEKVRMIRDLSKETSLI